MNKLITKLIASFETGPGGFSARKLTAFTLTACVVYIHMRWVDHSNVENVLIIDLLTVLALLGIVTAEQLIRLKNGTNEKPENQN